MEETIISIMNQFGYLGVLLLIAIENIYPPIPSEVILTFGGFMTTFSNMTVFGVVISATIGALLGAIVLYAVGRGLNTERLERLVEGRLGKLLRLKKGDIKKAESWFLKYGNKAVFFCRFVPIVRSLISIPAGSSKMKMSSFLFFTTTGTFIWNLVLVFLGRFTGNAWESAAECIDTYSTILFIVLVLGVLGFTAVVFLKKRLQNKDVQPVLNEES